MEWIERLNEAMAYIEAHIQDEIRLEEAAKIACTSSYNFQRVFSYMTGIPVSEYIRRRRMSLAAEDLRLGNEKIIDIALRFHQQPLTVHFVLCMVLPRLRSARSTLL